jgi:hypothetical protein
LWGYVSKDAARRAAALIKDFHFGARTRPPRCVFPCAHYLLHAKEIFFCVQFYSELLKKSYPHFFREKTFLCAFSAILKEKTHLRRESARAGRSLVLKEKDTYQYGKEKEGQEGKEAPLVLLKTIPPFGGIVFVYKATGAYLQKV